jgi:hypothetical protein
MGLLDTSKATEYLSKQEDAPKKGNLTDYSVTKRIRYGPFVMKPASEMSWESLIGEERGMMQSMKKIAAPCTNCIVLNGRVRLEFENGTHANIDRGIYLHHSIMMDGGKRRVVATNCPGAKGPLASGPSIVLGGGSDDAMQWFTSYDGKFKSGYFIDKGDTFTMLTDVMTYLPYRENVYVALDMEYIPEFRSDYSDIVTIIESVNQCHSPTFDLPLKPWSKVGGKLVLPWNGTLVSTVGHLHDGGVAVKVRMNDEEVCDSVATYGVNPEYVSSMKATDGKPWTTISNMRRCSPVKEFTKGTVMEVTTSYDLTQHPLRLNNERKAEQVMGFAISNIAVPYGTTEMPQVIL